MRNKDTEALKRSIVKFARGGPNEERKAVILRATEAKLADLLPANWAEDGSLKDGRAAWTTLEERETYNDLYTGLSDALDDMLGLDDLGAYYDFYYAWVQDVLAATETSGTVIFQSCGSLYSAPYTIDPEGPIMIGDPQKVRPVTSYIATERLSCDLCGDAKAIRHRSKPCPVCPKPQRGRTIIKPGSVEWRRSKVEMMAKSREHRHFATSPEVREADDGESWLFRGFASVYDVWYDMGWYEEQVALGAGRRTLSENPDVQLLLNHGGLPLARTVGGTLRLDERTIAGRTGLYSEADLDPADQLAQTLKRKTARGDLDEMSFAFNVTSDKWNEDFTRRVITTYSLHKGDVSVVNYGANPATSGASVRALNDVISILEHRAGKTLSAATMATLTQVLGLVASADDAVDEAQPLLAELMGVPSPDEEDVDARSVVDLPDYTQRARLRLAAMEGRR